MVAAIRPEFRRCKCGALLYGSEPIPLGAMCSACLESDWPPRGYPDEPNLADVQPVYANRECFEDDPWWDHGDKVDDARDRREEDGR